MSRLRVVPKSIEKIRSSQWNETIVSRTSSVDVRSHVMAMPTRCVVDRALPRQMQTAGHISSIGELHVCRNVEYVFKAPILMLFIADCAMGSGAGSPY
jgi:hypothetical protein